VAPVVVALYVGHVHRLGDGWVGVELPQVAPEVRVVRDAVEVALEVAVVDGVEADQRP
jgi:hypothetical protein